MKCTPKQKHFTALYVHRRNIYFSEVKQDVFPLQRHSVIVYSRMQLLNNNKKLFELKLLKYKTYNRIETLEIL